MAHLASYFGWLHTDGYAGFWEDRITANDKRGNDAVSDRFGFHLISLVGRVALTQMHRNIIINRKLRKSV